MVFITGRGEVQCLQCMTVDPMTELQAIDAVKQTNAENPGLLTYYPCQGGAGYHLTLAEARIQSQPTNGPDVA